MTSHSRLLVQADDVAITRAATAGVIDSIIHGVVRNAGLFTNRPDSARAAEFLREIDGIDVGIDLNFVTGAPILPASQIPNLVNARAQFRSSREIRANYPVVRQEGFYSFFEKDPFDYDQTLAEARAQIQRFVELMGRPPSYLHHHSVISEVSNAVLQTIAAESGVLLIDDLYRFGAIPLLENPWYPTTSALDAQAESDPFSTLSSTLSTIAHQDLSLMILHPGYIDAELLEITTMSLTRARDASLATSAIFAHLLEEENIELVTYTQIAEDLRYSVG